MAVHHSDSWLRSPALPARLTRTMPSLETAAVAAALFFAVVALGAADGGYFPSSWGWLALASIWVALMSLLLRGSVAASRVELAYVAALTALLGWTALSLFWTPTTTQTVYEVERTLSYLAFAVAVVLVVRRSHFVVLLGSLLTAITALCTYSLAIRLFPGRLVSFDPFVAYRLSEPIGYWNAVALLAVLGSILALGFATRAAHSVTRGLAAATLPILLPTLYYTFGRGGWLGLFAGLACVLVVDRSRLQFLAAALPVLPWPVLAIRRSYEAKGLTTDYSPREIAATDGRSLGLMLLVLCLLAFVSTVLFTYAARRVAVPRVARTLFAVLVTVVALTAAGATVFAYGGPSSVVRKAADSVRQSSPNVSGDQTQRLFSLSAHGRFDMWSSALDGAADAPLLGMGAGSYEQWWLQTRDVPMKIRDAHSLPLEMAAELGIVGAVLLSIVFLLPLVAGIRARGEPLVPIALGGLVAYIAHASVDWQWEMPVVTVIAFGLAGCLLLTARDRGMVSLSGRGPRVVAVVTLALGGVLAFGAMNGNRAVTQARAAVDREDVDSAVVHARAAERWSPWSSAPLQLQGDAALLEDDLAAARRLYRQAIAKDPQNWELWLGLSLSTSGSQRREAFREARRLNPLANQIVQLAASGL